ncbi:GntR family transcriptional regulator [Mesorhizobium sp. M0663]|uniref:GntR family transcriptional regulator n=1 Tax=Mesorhizobium sp. M0663 TaxID=2956981 RepID=UPI00333BE645
MQEGERNAISRFDQNGAKAMSSGLVELDVFLNRRSSASEQIYSVLREAIVRAKLLPGESISENAVCRQFNVSRTPVRAAIQRLAEDGLVSVFPQLGSFVSQIDIVSIQDSHFVRRSLETCLLREVAPRWTPAMSAEMRSLVAAQERSIAEGDIDGFHDNDENFHQLFASFAQRPGVWTTIHAAKAKLTRFIRFSGNAARFAVVLQEHLAILDALDANDGPGAEAALVAHLDKIFVLFDAHASETRHAAV